MERALPQVRLRRSVIFTAGLWFAAISNSSVAAVERFPDSVGSVRASKPQANSTHVNSDQAGQDARDAPPAETADEISKLIADLGASQAKATRLAAATAIAKRRDAKGLMAAKALSQGCRDKDPEVRIECVTALGLVSHNNKQPCPQVIIEAIFDSEERVSEAAANVSSLFAKRLAKESVPFLVRRIGDPRANVRATVVILLSYQTGKVSNLRALLRQAAHDRSLLVRSNATAGLWRGKEPLTSLTPLWLDLAEADKTAVGEDDGLQRAAALGATFKLRESCLESPQVMATTLTALLSSRSAPARAAAARTLGAAAGEAQAFARSAERAGARSELKRLLDDDDKYVRDNAAVALEAWPK